MVQAELVIVYCYTLNLVKKDENVTLNFSGEDFDSICCHVKSSFLLSLQDKSEMYSPSPVPQGPLSAFGNMRAFLASQLQRTSQANFDTSVELPSPLQRHGSTDKRTGAEAEPAELPENTDYHFRTDVTKPPLPPQSQTKVNVNKEKTETPGQLSENREKRLKGDWHKETPDRRKDAQNTSVKSGDR